VRRQNIDFSILVVSAAFLTILLLLYSINSHLNQKSLRETGDTGYIVKASGRTPSLYPSLADPVTNSENPSGVNKGGRTLTSPSNPANTGESLIGSFLNPKVLLSSAIDQIRKSTTGTINITPNRRGPIVVWNYDTVLLSRQTIPPKDFIPLFDALPYGAMNGYMSAKLPCSANSTSPLKIFIARINVGQSSELRPVPLQIVAQLSKPAYMCVYHGDIPSKNAGNETHIELSNPTSSQVILPDTSSAAIGFNETIPSHNDRDSR
jgi:hypothetical protein